MVEATGKKWYEQTWVIVLFLIFFWPVGLFFMWKFADWKKSAKTIVTVVISVYILFCIGMVILFSVLGFAALSEQSNPADTNPIGIEEDWEDEDLSNILDETQEEETEWDLNNEPEDVEEIANEDNTDSAAQFSRLEDLTLHFDDRDWQVGFEHEDAGNMMREYVVDGESVEAWTELVTAQFFPDLQGIAPTDCKELLRQTS
ncbi:hypothetical protein ACA29_07965 [Lederbergia galactosidilytica]|uniref:Uncharacterized protein n=1 Tax=Lederbergia galactosidilytica TaxID=217031 RepID=A0A0Q9Y7M9_9BACI|nr:hypothetical protein ACA29_07965 [Lederbergia galactosidilytica]